MIALSVKQPWASMIAEGQKTIETRTWQTKHRGDLLIVASKSPRISGKPVSAALCIVNVIDCRPMTAEDESAACCPVYPGAYAWVLDNVRPIDHFPVRGSLCLYHINIP
jgi:hypothetical protein